MRIPITFTKASGAGNDFVILNNIRGDIAVDYPAFARVACDRHFGIGGDGLLVVEKSTIADFAMRYFNADGSWGGMCGNGGRCIARYAHVGGIAGARQRFEALGHIYEAEVGSATVRLHMKDPVAYRDVIPLDVSGSSLLVSFVDTGAPHAVVVGEAVLESIDVTALGRALREHPHFRPDGTNVNFIRKRGDSSVQLRTYERGVEAETLACGTGSVASALVASDRCGLKSPVRVLVKSGEELIVHFRGTKGDWSDVSLEGSAHLLFSGNLVFQTDPPSLQLPS